MESPETNQLIKCFIVMIHYFGALPLFITQIIFGTQTQQYSSCDSFVGVSDWLIVQGSTAIGTAFFAMLLMAAINCKNTCQTTFYRTMLYLSLIWQCVWQIVGSVMFWRDCLHLTPASTNDLMWASLIIGHLLYLCAFAWLGRDEKEAFWL